MQNYQATKIHGESKKREIFFFVKKVFSPKQSRFFKKY